MSDALTPLRHVYGLESHDAAPGGTEYEVLRGMVAALDAAPTHSPSPDAVAAVLARAVSATAASVEELRSVRYVYGEADAPGGTVETAVLSQTSDALDQAFAARPQPRPHADVLARVEARAAEAAETVSTDRPALAPLAVALGGAGTRSAESALLAQTLDALARTPRPRPPAQAVDAVLSFAASASAETATSGVDAVRYVYDGGDRPDAPIDVALIEQSRKVIDRALASRPQPRPEASAIDAVLARAAEASAQRADEPTVSDPALAPLALTYALPLATETHGGGVEAALLAQSQDALARLRPAAPTAAAVANVLARAAAASRPARSAAADRPAARPARRRISAPVWAGGAALMLAAITAIAVLPGLFGSTTPTGSAEVASATASGGAEIAAIGVGGEDPVPAPPSDPDPVATPPVSAPVAVAPVVAEAAPVAARRPASPSPRPAVAATSAPRPAPETSTWESGEDVRALSLRLEEIDRSIEGLAWDEPAEVFGRPTGMPSNAITSGIRVVREGAAPARARIQPADSSRSQR